MTLLRSALGRIDGSEDGSNSRYLSNGTFYALCVQERDENDFSFSDVLFRRQTYHDPVHVTSPAILAPAMGRPATEVEES